MGLRARYACVSTEDQTVPYKLDVLQRPRDRMGGLLHRAPEDNVVLAIRLP